MELILAIGLLILVFGALAYPLVRPRTREGFVWQGTETLSELLAQRDGLYTTLRDLQADFEQGKLEAADFQALQGRYMARAAGVLQRLDAIQAGTERSDDEVGRAIEAEVAVLRKSRPGAAPQVRARPAEGTTPLTGAQPKKAPSAAAVGEGNPAGFCHNCGAPRAEDDRFCRRCGAALRGA